MAVKGTEFSKNRRQQFLNQRYFEKDIQFFKDTVLPGSLLGVANAEHAADRENSAGNLAYWTFKAYLLRYTAGESLDVLRGELTDVVEAHEQHAKSLQDYAQDPHFPVLRFVEIADYERVMQLVGLCFLLHRRELLPRLAAMLDGAYAGKDTLYEDLLAYELEGRYDVDEWYHDCPYRELINSLYRNTSEESIADLQRYVTAWYPSMKKAPWHDSYLDTCEDGGAYFGYWAIEAGAVAYLLELDDSSFRDHIVYPKDLVDYARTLDKPN